MFLDSKWKVKILNRIVASIIFPHDCEIKYKKHIQMDQNEAQRLVFL
jgi:hypothetical protein